MRIKTSIKMLMAAALFLVLLSGQSLAAEEIDLKKEISLTISNIYGGKPLSGVKYELYLIGKMNESGEIILTDSFKKYEEKANVLEEKSSVWAETAEYLEMEIQNGNAGEIKSDVSGVTDEEGKIVFSSEEDDLVMGLYLVMGTREKIDGHTYSTLPFMVMLPAEDMTENMWDYDVEVRAKPEEEFLPQTGQLWWPALLLLGGGVIFVVVGFKRRGSSDET